jgi:transcriptional regulator with XRE-family HTH domain
VPEGRRVNTRSKLGALIFQRGLRVYDVCAATRIGYSSINHYNNLRRPIPANHLLKLSQYFDVEPEELIGTVDDNPV